MKISKQYIDCKLTTLEVEKIVKFSGLKKTEFYRKYIKSSGLPYNTYGNFFYKKVPVWFCRFITCEPDIYKIVSMMATNGDIHHVNAVKNAARKDLLKQHEQEKLLELNEIQDQIRKGN